MKIEQLKKLSETITRQQLRELVSESNDDIDEYLRIQEFFNRPIYAQLNISTQNIIGVMFRLYVSGYPETVEFIMNKLRIGVTCDKSFYDRVFNLMYRLIGDLNKGIVYDKDFLEVLITCIVDKGFDQFSKILDAYTDASKEGILEPYIIRMVSNKNFILNRYDDIPAFIAQLHRMVSLDESDPNLHSNIKMIQNMILSDDLLTKRTRKEHENLIDFFALCFDANKSEQNNKLFNLITSGFVVSNTEYDEQLYLLNEFKDQVLLKDKHKKTLERLFLDPKVYNHLTFDFQVYLINILDHIKENMFFIKINKLLDQENERLALEIKELIKTYTIYARTVSEIINSSTDAKSAIDIIATEAKLENITELDDKTKLVLIPHDLPNIKKGK